MPAEKSKTKKDKGSAVAKPTAAKKSSKMERLMAMVEAMGEDSE
jgi:hypothetical protein